MTATFQVGLNTWVTIPEHRLATWPGQMWFHVRRGAC